MKNYTITIRKSGVPLREINVFARNGIDAICMIAKAIDLSSTRVMARLA